jgi:rod shape-determining protein MreC
MSGSGLLRLSLFDANAVLQPGQEIVTYASVNDRPEVPGVPVGTVISVHSGALIQTALVRPFVTFTALGVVGIVVAVPRHSAGISILPVPAPTVTVTTTPAPASVSPGNVGPSASGSPSVSPSPTASASGGG